MLDVGTTDKGVPLGHCSLGWLRNELGPGVWALGRGPVVCVLGARLVPGLRED
jgi:hypothetical protein